MGLRGPKSADELAGIEFRRRQMRANPASLPDEYAPPQHLSEATQTWWEGIVGALESHQLRTLQAAAEAWDLYSQCREAVARDGLSYSDNKGRMFARPEIAIGRDARAAYLRCMRDLKLDAPPPKEKVDRQAHLGISWRDRVGG